MVDRGQTDCAAIRANPNSNTLVRLLTLTYDLDF